LCDDRDPEEPQLRRPTIAIAAQPSCVRDKCFGYRWVRDEDSRDCLCFMHGRTLNTAEVYVALKQIRVSYGTRKLSQPLPTPFISSLKQIKMLCYFAAQKNIFSQFCQVTIKLGKVTQELACGTRTQRQPPDGKLLVEGKATAPVAKGRWRRRHRSSKDGDTVQFAPVPAESTQSDLYCDGIPSPVIWLILTP